MSGKCGDVNYDDVNMDMSDSDESGSEMFGNKKEYEAYKKQFSSKSAPGSQQKAQPSGGEYGGDVEAGSEYGAGTDKVAVVGNKFGHTEGHRAEGGERGGGSSGLGPGDKKVERRALMYGDRDQRDSGRRSKSKDRHARRRSGSRDRDRHRDRDYRKRSRSRSPNRRGGGGGHHHRGGRERQDNRDRRREDGARNHESQMKKVREMGVELPKYLKPGAVNPLSYAEQMQKRKAMWAKPATKASEETGTPEEAPSKPEPVEIQPSNASNKRSYNNWESTNFGNETANEKFRRLMGIKNTGGESSAPTTEQSGPIPGKDHEKIMNDLDRNYEAARQQTHRNRGMGMGFSEAGLYSQMAPTPAPAAAPAPAPLPSLGAGKMFRNTGWQNRASGGINFVKKP